MAGLNRTDLKELREAWFKGAATDVKNAEVLAGLAEREFPAEEFETFQKLFLTKEGKPKAKAGSKGALTACPRLEEIFTAKRKICRSWKAKLPVCGFLLRRRRF